MNIPSRPEDNWSWRLEKDAITSDLIKKISDLIDVADRDPVASRTMQHLSRDMREEFAA